MGGSCFPRDLKSLIETFATAGVAPRILRAVDESNNERLVDPLDKVEGDTVLVLGRSYKSGVPETKGSPAVALSEVLMEKGYQVETYDPKFDAAPPRLTPDTVIVTVAEPQFRNLEAITGKAVRVVLDYAGVVDASSLSGGAKLWQAGKGWINRPDKEPDVVGRTRA